MSSSWPCRYCRRPVVPALIKPTAASTMGRLGTRLVDGGEHTCVPLPEKDRIDRRLAVMRLRREGMTVDSKEAQDAKQRARILQALTHRLGLVEQLVTNHRLDEWDS